MCSNIPRTVPVNQNHGQLKQISVPRACATFTLVLCCFTGYSPSSTSSSTNTLRSKSHGQVGSIYSTFCKLQTDTFLTLYRWLRVCGWLPKRYVDIMTLVRQSQGLQRIFSASASSSMRCAHVTRPLTWTLATLNQLKVIDI